MVIPPPTSDDLAKIAERYGLRLDADDVESFRALVTRSLRSHDAVEQLYAASRPEPPDRGFETHVAHRGGHHGVSGELSARLHVARAQQHDRIAVDHVAVLV